MTWLEKLFFYLLIFCLPFQIRTIIWPKQGTFDEWNSAFFYLTDFFILVLLFFWLIKLIKHKKFSREIITLILFLLIALLSILQAANKYIGFYHWLKLLEMILLFIWLWHNFKFLNKKIMARILVVSGLLQSIIAILQFVKQQNLGLKFLGESVIDPYIAGVAKFVVDYKIVVRAYGTLPHPNILAAFLLLAIFCLYFLYLSRKQYSIWWNLWYGIIYCALMIGLGYTYSRGVIIVFLALTIFYFIFLYKRHPLQIKFLIIIFLLLVIIFSYSNYPQVKVRFNISLKEQAIDLRLQYNQMAFNFIKNHPLLGVGLGNFVYQERKDYPGYASWVYQPVHNIYLLVASEIGLLGFVLFLFFLFLIIKKRNHNLFSLSFYFLLLCFLLIGFFDHFFLTLQQGQIMWWLVLGIVACHLIKLKEKPKD